MRRQLLSRKVTTIAAYLVLLVSCRFARYDFFSHRFDLDALVLHAQKSLERCRSRQNPGRSTHSIRWDKPSSLGTDQAPELQPCGIRVLPLVIHMEEIIQ